MIQLSCKNCGQKLNIDDNHLGKQVKCPKCGRVVLIPDNSNKITFQCNSCGQKIRVTKIQAGKKVKCPKCQNIFIVPNHKTTPITLTKPRTSIPSSTVHNPNQEELEEPDNTKNESFILPFIISIAALFIVAFIIWAKVIHPSANKRDALQGQQQVSESNLSKQTKIAFYSYSVSGTANIDIYIMNADGSEQKNLTNSPGNDYNPSWSPDGKKIAFSSDMYGASSHILVIPDDRDNFTGSFIDYSRIPNGSSKIFIINVDSGEPIELTNSLTFSGREPSWSPDGKKINFHSAIQNEEIYVMDANNGDLIKLASTSIPGNDFLFLRSPCSWSPTGEKMLFNFTLNMTNNFFTGHLDPYSGNGEIFVMNADGSEWKNITNSSSSSESEPSQSPDGNKIVLGLNRGKDNEIRLMSVSEPSWSPDGNKIAFKLNRGKDSEICIMNADGTELVRLTSNSSVDNCPIWSPDGRKIAYVSRRDGNEEIYVMNTNGSEQKNISNNPSFDRNPSWSPDSKKIAFDSDRDGDREIYIMNADGSEQTRLTDNTLINTNPIWSPYIVSEE